jgi:hypothetical protein
LGFAFMGLIVVKAEMHVIHGGKRDKYVGLVPA